MTTPEQRKRNTEWARQNRAKRLAARNATSATCQARMGRHGLCGGVLESFTDGNGRASFRCPLCERKKRGICRDCGLPVYGQVGKAIRCEFHAKEAKDVQWRRYKDNNAAVLRKRARQYYQHDEIRRERRNARKLIWRKAHPEKVKQYKRREALQQNPKRLAYHAKRRQREREALRARERARGRGITELRTCLTPGCDIVVTGRKKKCTRCKERQVNEARAMLAELQRSA